MQKRGYWKTRLGFYIAAVGSACGLGNLWRFPYVVGENGGGAFVLLYVLIALLIGMPLLIGELILGKSSRQGVLMSIRNLELPFVRSNIIITNFGKLSVLFTSVFFSYYALISGWVLFFLIQFLIKFFLPVQLQTNYPLDFLIKNHYLQLIFSSMHIFICLLVVAHEVQEGLEKWVHYLMPIFIFLLAALVGKSLSLPSGGEALRFFFYPDFSKLTTHSLLQAIGHVFFTLSVGLGTMVTFGSYLRKYDQIPAAGFRVALFDTLLSLISGLVVFPMALSISNLPLNNAELMFDAVPPFFSSLEDEGALFGLIFFTFLYVSSLGSSIGLLETVVSNLVDRKRIRRRNIIKKVAIFTFFLVFFFILFFNARDLDTILINWHLPLIALVLSLIIGWGLSLEKLKRYFIHSQKFETIALFSHWFFIIRWVSPFVIILAFILGLF